MKLKLLVFTTLFGAARLAFSQTADDYVAQGRSLLGETNLMGAHSRFAQALALSPNHATANVFYAATRILTLAEQPAGSNFLNRLGLPLTGRNPWNWTAQIPHDTNGVPFTAAGLNGTEFSLVARTNLLPTVIAAGANLAKVTDPGFTLTLTSNEAHLVEVTLDYGDILIFRAGLHELEYVLYTLCGWNADIDLSGVRELLLNDELSIERVLMEHPALLSFATTNDLNAAKLAFGNAAQRYQEASAFIRNRPAGVVRLFNYDPANAGKELRFRTMLSDLTNSLAGAVTFSLTPRFTIFAGAQFNGQSAPRSWLPYIRGNGFGLGTAPDPTFGGTIFGLDRNEVDQLFQNALFPIPSISPVFSRVGGRFEFPLTLAPDHGYVMQVSTNLLDWQDCGAFFGSQTASFSDDSAALNPRRFYRVVDRTDNMPQPANDLFANRALIPGVNVPVTGYTANATTEAGEPQAPGAGHTIWWKWTAPRTAVFAVVADGGESCWAIVVYTNATLSTLGELAHGWSSLEFSAKAGVTYQIAVDTCGQDGGVRVIITQPPVLTITRPYNGEEFTWPELVQVMASASDPDGQVSKLSAMVWGQFQATIFGSTLTFSTNLQPGSYYLDCRAVDNVGATSWASSYFQVHPANDNFANAIAISGAPLVVSGTVRGASVESGEPDHGGGYASRTVWWSWTATQNGPIAIACNVTNEWWPTAATVAVYTGTGYADLEPVVSDTSEYASLATVTFTAQAGHTYKIAVACDEDGMATLRLVPTLPPVVQIEEPADGSVIDTPTNVLLVATAADPDGTVARVEFYRDGDLLGTAYGPAWSITWSNVLAEGSVVLQALAYDNAGAVSLSDPVTIEFTAPPPPNDNFADRIVLTGSIVTTNGTNVGASEEPAEPVHYGTLNGGKSLWWSWQAPANGTVEISTAGSSIDTVLAVYTGDTLLDLLLVANNDDAVGLTSKVTFIATAGTFYQIAVDAYGGETGSISLRVAQQ